MATGDDATQGACLGVGTREVCGRLEKAASDAWAVTCHASPYWYQFMKTFRTEDLDIGLFYYTSLIWATHSSTHLKFRGTRSATHAFELLRVVQFRPVAYSASLGV